MKSVVKIDLCGSKEYVDSKGDRGQARQANLSSLVTAARDAFPSADSKYPDGSYYRAEGDAVYLILSDPTVALRGALEFSKTWFSLLPEKPDCRILVATGEIAVNYEGELTSEVFENIATAEKTARPGHILVDDLTRDLADHTAFQFLDHRKIAVTAKREIGFSLLNYQDPRLADDSALVHAVFVADPNASEAMTRSFEVLALEYLRSLRDGKGSIGGFGVFLERKGCPRLDDDSQKAIAVSSSLVDLSSDGTLTVSEHAQALLSEWRNSYDRSKKDAIDSIADAIGQSVGLSAHAVLDRVDVATLTERYISAVFMEVRMMANYYRSTEQFYERLAISPDYDYIIRRHIKDLDLAAEEELFFRREFLKVLRQLTVSSNPYIAAVFHNVLMLFYLNQGKKQYANVQIELIKDKRFYLDTNALYAYMVSASQYHSFLTYAVGRLVKLGADVRVFHQSVREYNDSLFSALHRAERERGFGFEFANDRPWIWQEFVSDTVAYQNEFGFCVKKHTIPPRVTIDSEPEIEQISASLQAVQLQYEEIQPYRKKEEIDDIYQAVWDAKRRRVYSSDGSFYYEEPSGMEYKVLHDANCIQALRCPGDSPYDTKSIFITCDFRLTRVRKTLNHCNFLTSILEFQEFITPYLLLSTDFSASKTEVPNLLLAASIDLELSHTKYFTEIVGEYLRGSNVDSSDWDLLVSEKNRTRFNEVGRKIHKAIEDSDKTREHEAWNEAAELSTEYTAEIASRLGMRIARTALQEKDEEISRLKQQLAKTEVQLQVARKKQAGKERYQRAQARKRGERI